jgi:hypothetical protein
MVSGIQPGRLLVLPLGWMVMLLQMVFQKFFIRFGIDLLVASVLALIPLEN